jgi:hypothetical protein
MGGEVWWVAGVAENPHPFRGGKDGAPENSKTDSKTKFKFTGKSVKGV